MIYFYIALFLFEISTTVSENNYNVDNVAVHQFEDFVNIDIAVSSEIIDDVFPRFVDIPGGDGVMHRVDLAETPDMATLNEAARFGSSDKYLLFTRQNPTSAQRLRKNDISSITSSNFDASRETVIIVHGWFSNQNSDINKTIRDAYLAKADVNIIVVDWSPLSYSTYVTATIGVPGVGRRLGQFLSFLNKATGAPFARMHLVGHSLGAHVIGNAGRELNGAVARITGLDPVGPLWSSNGNRIRASDGKYVEGIHTDGNNIIGLGSKSAIGDADFYPNGGVSQPGCNSGLCDHSRAWQLFAATVTYDHLEGRQCNNMLQVSSDQCNGIPLKMGNDDLNKRGYGIFRVNTKSTYPY